MRTIRDTAPSYSAVAVDTNSNEVILQDNNLWEYQVFDRFPRLQRGPPTSPRRNGLYAATKP